MAADFSEQSYWHQRYQTETSFEWLISSEHFMSVINPYLDQHLPGDASSARILHLGGDTSDLQNHFRARGLVDVTNVDFEPLAADRGRDLERRTFGDVRMRYAVADVTQLPERIGDSSTFDLVVDKSTCDAVACGGDAQVRRMSHSVRRCLADGGVWLSLSFSGQRFDVDDMPFEVETIAQIPTPKLKETDPNIYYWVYRLRPVS